MSNKFNRVSELLGVQKRSPEIADDVFTSDTETTRRVNAYQRKAEFNQYAASSSGQTAKHKKTQSPYAVRRDYRHLVQANDDGTFASINKDKIRPADISGRSIRRSHAATDRAEEAANDLTTLNSPHLFQTRENYEAQFDEQKIAAQKRAEATKKQEKTAENRQHTWEDAQANRLQEVIEKAEGEFDPRNMFGGANRLSGVVNATSGNFGILDENNVNDRVDAKKRTQDARRARQAAISRSTEEEQSVDEQLANKLEMMGKSVQAQSANKGLAAQLSSMFDPAQ